DQDLDEACQGNRAGGSATKQHLDVIPSVLARPRLVVDRLPLNARHVAMVGDGVLKVILIEIGIHVDPFFPKGLMVLAPGQRREHDELDDVEWKFALNNVNV